jgi:hypothetical protein
MIRAKIKMKFLFRKRDFGLIFHIGFLVSRFYPVFTKIS